MSPSRTASIAFPVMTRERTLSFEHNGRTLRVTKGRSRSYSTVSAFLYGHELWPGGLRLDGFREGMSRRRVMALATAEADRLDAHYRAFLARTGADTSPGSTVPTPIRF